jgi:3-dehydroquinate synthetase
MSQRQIEMGLGSDRFTLHVGRGLTNDLVSWLSRAAPDTVIVVTDETVLSHYEKTTVRTLQERFRTVVISMPPGEASKTMPTLERLLEEAAAFGISKRSHVVAFGGGMVGNIAGMVAGLLMRGIPLVHVPTTLLAQIDAAISRKQAVNGRRGKNLFGLWLAPKVIFSDLDYLGSLSAREMSSGLAEAIKLSLIADIDQFARYSDWDLQRVMRDREVLEDIVQRSIDLTCSILSVDPAEGTSGLSLEIGHTVGHAIEILKGGELTHGESISIGMLIEAEMSVSRGLLDPSWVPRIRNTLRRYGLPTRPPSGISPERIVEALKFDNKRRDQETVFVPICNPGVIASNTRRHAPLPLGELRSAMQACERDGVLQVHAAHRPVGEPEVLQH